MTADARARELLSCRICDGQELHPFLDLGPMPLSNAFLEHADLGVPESRYPLGIVVCETCWLAQLTHVVSAELMYANYPYLPSTSRTMLGHFERLARSLTERYGLTERDTVVDIGSNDGTLLSWFRRAGVGVLGVDPAANLAHVARAKGIGTLGAVFSASLAGEIRQNGRVRLVVATNSIAHVPDLRDFCEGLSALLTDDGVFVAEFPYFVELLRKNEFDTIYHEHLSYFSLHPLVRLFGRHGMEIFDVEEVSVHGGSLRVHVGRAGQGRAVSARLSVLLAEEARLLRGRSAYALFAERARHNMGRLVELLGALKIEGRRVIGYGASAKGNVLLNCCGIDRTLVDYVVDSIPYKHGRFTPGMHLPVHPEEKLDQDEPDYALVLAWNFIEEILEKQTRFLERGGRFILAVPDVHVLP